ncbi:MAG: hypothetical protein V7K83_04195 [Nostoc sp.]
MLVLETSPQDLRQSRNEQYFQPEAGNEVLKGFWLKLTPMSFFCAPTMCCIQMKNDLRQILLDAKNVLLGI